MSEQAPLSREMLNTLRTMALNSLPEGHGAWRLFGYIDWLEERLDEKFAPDNCWDLPGWREMFDHPDTE